MKGKTISIRLDTADLYYLEQTQKMRSEHLNQNNYIVLNESYSDLIRRAILRFYNDTFEYYIYESPDFIVKKDDEN